MLLSRVYRLHDIDDVEALCSRAARTWATKTECRFEPDEVESLISFLVAAVWKMGERYDPARSPSFRAVVLGRLSNRCTDWFRTHRGRTRWQFSGHTYERDRPQPVSLDDAAGADGSPLADAVGAVDRDLETSSSPDPFGGLLDDRDSEADWDLALCRALAARLLRERAQRARAA